MPCRLLGEQSGVETYYAPASEVFSDPKTSMQLAGDRDYCISFRWGGSSKRPDRDDLVLLTSKPI